MKCLVIYTSDIRRRTVLNSTDHDFADDKQMHLSFEPELIMMAIEAMNSDLDNIYKWSVSNGLQLNISIVQGAVHSTTRRCSSPQRQRRACVTERTES